MQNIKDVICKLLWFNINRNRIVEQIQKTVLKTVSYNTTKMAIEKQKLQIAAFKPGHIFLRFTQLDINLTESLYTSHVFLPSHYNKHFTVQGHFICHCGFY